MASLTVRLEAAEKKIGTQDIRLKSNTAERDRAVQQLAEAYCTTEELRAENESLKQENEVLRNRISQYLVENAEATREWQKKESTLRKKIQRRDNAVKEVKEITRELYETRNSNIMTISHDKVVRQTRSRDRGSREKSGLSKNVFTEDVAPSTDNAPKRTSRGRHSTGQLGDEQHTQDRSRPRSRSQSQRRQTSSDVRRNNEDDDLKEQYSSDEDSAEDGDSTFDEATGTTRKSHRDMDEQRNSTEDGSEYLSILDGGEMAHLREMLRNAKIEQRERLISADSEAKEDDTIYSRKSARSTTDRPQERLQGILKNGGTQMQEDLTGRLSIKNATFSSVQKEHISRPSTPHQAKQSSSNRRRQIDNDELTSAFIIPDLSFNIGSDEMGQPVLSENARRILDGLCRHNSQNCMICARVASYDTEGMKRVQVEKPIPVSERMPVPGPYEDEPTIRPAVAPGLALATVIKALEDEVAHLKLKHAQLFSLYNRHDASLGMRKRKSLQKKLTMLLKAIDTKSDQIYALYDVLEGQRQSGQEMTEREVEVTLMNIGVDPEDITKVSRKSNGLTSDDDGDDASNEDSELDLPWEGIEDTTDTVDAKKASA